METDMKAGLCDSCVHRRLIVNDRGSAFVICLLSESDHRYQKYPRLPVLQCGGFEDKSTMKSRKAPQDA
jgi:hypothetical protein